MKIALIENNWLNSHYTNHGWGNGYVAIPKGHPCHGLDYNAIHDKFEISVSGGLTFSCKGEDFRDFEKFGFKKTDWVVGFDTCHYWDTLAMWPKCEVEKETLRLRDQLMEIK